MNIVGNGGLTKQIIDVIKSFNTYSISRGGEIDGWSTKDYEDDDFPYLVGHASMHNLEEREWTFDRLVAEGKMIGTIISPNAIVSPVARVYEGGIILHGAYVGPHAMLDKNVLIGTRAIVEHDSLIGQHSIVLTGAIVNGGCNIGCRVMIGSGAIILNDITVCDDVKIGAGAVVIKDIVESGTYVGNPARRVE